MWTWAKKIFRRRIPIPDRKCRGRALKAQIKLKKDGYEVRLQRGFYKGKPHMWAEFFRSGSWCVYDISTGICGWSIENKKVKKWYKVDPIRWRKYNKEK